MTDLGEIGIIGAGMAGLACARALVAGGRHPVIFDKGRGVGGRMATRRAEGGVQFDHGAQYLTARSDRFAAWLDRMEAEGIAVPWNDGTGRRHLVGLPGMSGLAKAIGSGLEIVQQHEVTGVSPSENGWAVTIGAEKHLFARLVLAIPAPQARRLVCADHGVAAALDRVRFAPCLTLMATFAGSAPEPFASRRDPDDPLAWIALDSSKPRRTGGPAWVALAGSGWSAEHLEKERPDIAALMLPLLCDRIGARIDQVRHAAGHRWRYARVISPLGQPFVKDDGGRLHAGGDWCLGARAEDAWVSGTAIAEDILSRP